MFYDQEKILKTLSDTPATFKSSLKKLEYSRKHRKEYKKTFKGRATVLVNNARSRSVNKGIEITLSIDWVEKQLEKGTCQLTNIPFNLDPPAENVTRRWDAPSLDRIDKTKPYNEENTRVVLWAVNCALAEYGTEIMLPILKAMVSGIENAKKKSTTPVSASDHNESAERLPFSPVLTTRFGENSDDAHHHCGADARKDADSSAKEGSGIGVGCGSPEMGPSPSLKNIKDPRHADSTVSCNQPNVGYLLGQLGELNLAAGTARKIRQFGD